MTAAALVAAQTGFNDGVSVRSWGIVIFIVLFVGALAAVAIPTILRMRRRAARLRRVDREVLIGEGRGERWSPRRLKAPVRMAFLPLQDAWSRGDVEPARGYLTDAQRERLEAELATRAAQHRANRVEDVVLDEVTILHAEGPPDGDPELFTAYVGWRARDWTEDVETGRVVDGKAARLRRFGQLWTFCHDPERGWLLTEVQDRAAEEATLALPPVAEAG